MRRAFVVTGLSVAVLALVGCVSPPGQSGWYPLHEDTDRGPARFGGQIGAEPPTSVTLTTFGVGIAFAQQVCVTVHVYDGPPPHSLPGDPDEVHVEQDCVPVPSLVPGENVITVPGLLSEWDETTQGELEGRWFLLSGIAQFFEPGGLFAPQVVRSAAFDGSSPTSPYCDRFAPSPCP